MKFVLRSVNNARYFLRYYGMSRSVAFVLPKLITSLRTSERFISWKESAVDSRLGITTVGNVEVADLDIATEAKRNAVEYCPTSGFTLGVILKELRIRHADFTFVDIGCGKGRVLCLAAEFPFCEIVGVEISKRLCRVSEENLSKMFPKRKKCHRSTIENIDATGFEFPTSPLVVYFFNPFGESVMQRVIDNIVESWHAIPRQIYVVYSNPVHQKLFEASDFWTPTVLSGGPVRQSWAVYQTPPH